MQVVGFMDLFKKLSRVRILMVKHTTCYGNEDARTACAKAHHDMNAMIQSCTPELHIT